MFQKKLNVKNYNERPNGLMGGDGGFIFIFYSSLWYELKFRIPVFVRM